MLTKIVDLRWGRSVFLCNLNSLFCELVVTQPFCRQKVCNTDQIQNIFLQNPDQIQTNYPYFSKIHTNNIFVSAFLDLTFKHSELAKDL